MTASSASPSSLLDLPDPLLRLILSYIADHVSLCRMESTSKTLQALAKHPDLWDGLHRHRWTFQKKMSSSASSSCAFTNNNKAEYERRHRLDVSVVQYLECLRHAKQSNSNSNNSSSSFGYAPNILRLFMQSGREAIDGCWKVHATTYDKDYQELIVSGIMLLQRVSLFQDLVKLRRNHDQVSDDERLEGYAILSSLLCSDTPYPNFEKTQDDIHRRLDDLADKVQQQFPSEDDDVQNVSDHEKVRIINHVLFHQEGFTGNVDHYYQFENSLLNKLLERKKAIPMTLAILYKLVARRVGLVVNVIGLPGHIIVGVPSVENCFIDVFRHGRILDLPAVANMPLLFGFPFRPELLDPLTPENILKRVCNNLANCLGGARGMLTYQHVPGVSTQRVFLVGLLKRLLYNPSAQLVETCHAGLGQMWLLEHGFSDGSMP